MEFKAFPKIERIGKLFMTITQKIHGTNAQIVIYEDENKDIQFKVGSRNRWITPLDDNYGFAAWVETNKEHLYNRLGLGTHFGEWAGPGINSGEGLEERTFVLFDYWKFPPERVLPFQTKVVPVLYTGPIDFKAIDDVMLDLKTNGSKLVPGFLRPEGVVITLGDIRYKKVFEAEETQWKKSDERKVFTALNVDLSHLLQPVRLEKLLSRDERYILEYPRSIGQIAQDYVKDLEDEGQIAGEPEVVKGIKKQLGRQLYPFLKDVIKEQRGL